MGRYFPSFVMAFFFVKIVLTLWDKKDFIFDIFNFLPWERRVTSKESEFKFDELTL